MPELCHILWGNISGHSTNSFRFSYISQVLPYARTYELGLALAFGGILESPWVSLVLQPAESGPTVKSLWVGQFPASNFLPPEVCYLQKFCSASISPETPCGQLLLREGCTCKAAWALRAFFFFNCLLEAGIALSGLSGMGESVWESEVFLEHICHHCWLDNVCSCFHLLRNAAAWEYLNICHWSFLIPE